MQLNTQTGCDMTHLYCWCDRPNSELCLQTNSCRIQISLVPSSYNYSKAILGSYFLDIIIPCGLGAVKWVLLSEVPMCQSS